MSQKELLAEAKAAIEQGRWQQALEDLETLKSTNTESEDVYINLAQVYGVRGSFLTVVQTYLKLAEYLIETGRLDEAEAALKRVLGLKPTSPEAREQQIRICRLRGKMGEALEHTRELARLLFDQGEGECSIALLQEAQKETPTDLDLCLEIAEMQISHGLIQDGTNGYRAVANAREEAGDWVRASEAYRRMKVVCSDDPELMLKLGRLYMRLGELDRAETEFREVLRHDLNHEAALLELGRVSGLQGRFRSGILAYRKALQNNPDSLEAKVQLGTLYSWQGMNSEACDLFAEVAVNFLEAEQTDRAIEAFQMVLGLEPDNQAAQQGLTNLGAPLTAKKVLRPEPPEPPSPSMETLAKSNEESLTSGDESAGPTQGSSRRGLIAPKKLRRTGLLQRGLSKKPVLGAGSNRALRKGLILPEREVYSSSDERPVLSRPGAKGATDDQVAELTSVEDVNDDVMGEGVLASEMLLEEPVWGWSEDVVGEEALFTEEAPFPVEPHKDIFQGWGEDPEELVPGPEETLNSEEAIVAEEPLSPEESLFPEEVALLDEPLPTEDIFQGWGEDLEEQVPEPEETLSFEETIVAEEPLFPEESLFPEEVALLDEPLFPEELFVEESSDISALLEATMPSEPTFGLETLGLDFSDEARPESGAVEAALETEDAGVGSLHEISPDPLLLESEPAVPTATTPPEESTLDGRVAAGATMVVYCLESEFPLGDLEYADRLEKKHSQCDVATRMAAYRRSIEEQPNNQVLRARLAGLYLKFGAGEEAARGYRRIAIVHPDSPSLLYLMAQADFWNEDYEGMARSLLTRAKLHFDRDEYYAALDALSSLLSLEPSHFEGRKLLARVFCGLNEDNLAVHHLQQLAEHALSESRLDEAAEALERLLTYGEDPQKEELLAEVHRLRGDREGALDRYTELQQRYQTEELWEAATRVTERLLELEPECIKLRKNLVNLHQKLGRSDRILAETLGLAKAYALAGKADRAGDLMEVLLTENSSSDIAEGLKRLVAASTDSVMPDLLGSLEARITRDPTNLTRRWAYGELCYHLKELDRAIEQFQNTRRSPKYEARSYNMLGLCFSRKSGFNMLSLAAKQFQKGLNTLSDDPTLESELRRNLESVLRAEGQL